MGSSAVTRKNRTKWCVKVVINILPISRFYKIFDFIPDKLFEKLLFALRHNEPNVKGVCFVRTEERRIKQAIYQSLNVMM
ncbi:MAG: hypothetical protein GXZ19_06580 [Bacteroidales bacterium]|nr:hypothetical protein [Bacteroidales bacterium]